MYIYMVKRTTVDIDQTLLERARLALGAKTVRGTIEQALRIVAERAEEEQGSRSAGQRQYLDNLRSRADLSVLASEEMWR